MTTAAAAPPLTPTQGASLYRPLNRSRNEIRLLRILPSATPGNDGDGLTLAQDIVQCQLEYESLDRIEDTNKEAESEDIAPQRALDTVLANTEMRTQKMKRIMESWEMEMKKGMNAFENEDTTRKYNLGSTRKDLLQQIHALSQKTMKEWLPPQLELLGTSATFHTWVQTWIWSPLSGDETYALAPSNAYFALSYVWAKSNPEFRYDLAPNLLINLGRAGGFTSEQLLRMKMPWIVETTTTPLKKAHIVLNGRLTEIGENLELALRTLREIPEIQSGMRVWVDSLCIDQHNFEEKNVEVKRMGEIYKKAQRVVSWLGEEQDRSGDVLELMNTLGEAIFTPEEGTSISQSFASNLDSEFTYRLTQFLCRPYWSRIWIVQEIAMSGENSIIICGPRRFRTTHILKFSNSESFTLLSSLPPLTNIGYSIGREYDPKSKGIPIGFFLDGFQKLHNLGDLRNNPDTMTCEDSFMNTLWFRTASSNNATDPRDLVYGMINLLPLGLVSHLLVEYSSDNTYQRVMTDFAAAHITNWETLSWILYRPWVPFAGYRNWPSWVPNLGLQFSSHHVDFIAYNFDSCRDFDANAFNVEIFPEVGLLCVEGFQLDTINQATISRSSKKQQEDLDPYLAQFSLLDKATEEEVTQFNFFQDTAMGLMGTFPEETLPASKIPPSSRCHRYKDKIGLKAAIAKCFQRLGAVYANESESIFDIPHHIITSASDPMGSKWRDLPGVTLPAMWYLRLLLETCEDLDLWGANLLHLFAEQTKGNSVPSLLLRNKTFLLARFFTTCSGYVGTALCNLRPGDKIYILRGCPMPVVLRPSSRREEAWELLGGIYIPGAMNGEAVIEHREQGGSMERMTIC